MVRSLLFSKVVRHGLAPAGGAATVTAFSFLVAGGEKYSAVASKKIALKTTSTVASPYSSIRVVAPKAVKRSQLKYHASTAAAGNKPTSETATRTAAKTASTTPSEASSRSAAFLRWYEGHLQATPVRTKMVTGSILWGLGDSVAQLVPPMAQGAPLPSYDWERTGRAAFFGFAIHAPSSHVHFNFLEWMTVRAGVTGLGIPVFKAFMEQFVYWSWFSNTLYHGAMGAMQGHTMDQIVTRIQDVLWETQKAQWVFWIPVQLLNFRFVPVRHQLNVVLLTSVVWTALLSAWYPPEEKPRDSDR
mmetsp:Transcript_31465/g.46694  ORF Transcript_31465/g.46694 Transcript_31465/m.46694 type:complete len:302 (-) Transcript_31465:134-1039(-)